MVKSYLSKIAILLIFHQKCFCFDNHDNLHRIELEYQNFDDYDDLKD